VKLTFTSRGWEDYLTLREDDQKIHTKLDALILECLGHPFFGTGKPEALKSNLKGWWSRRITQDHRLVYRVTGTGDEQVLEIAQCRFHY
jgi:toxin YoeB